MFAYIYNPEERSREHINHCANDKRELLDNRGFPNTPIAVTEFNSIAADLPTPYTFNHANALYMADTLARYAYNGADMVLHWELYDMPYDYSTGQVDTSYGLINNNDSSITLSYWTGEITLEDDFIPMPVYYTYFMYAQLFGDILVQSSSSMKDKLSIWASTDSAEPNTLKLMVVNLADESIETTLNLNGFDPTSGRYYELTSQDFVTAEDKATVIGGTYINGLEIDSSSAQSIIDSAQVIIDSGRPVGDLGDSFNHVFPAYSATIIVFDTTAALEIISCDASGTEKNQFVPGESVYVEASGLAADTDYKVWIQDDPVNEDKELNTSEDPSELQEIVTTNESGSFAPILIWSIPANEPITYHEYDIVVDKRDDEVNTGKYNAASDGIDSTTVAGIVAPVAELPTIRLFSIGLLVLAGYVLRRRF